MAVHGVSSCKGVLCSPEDREDLQWHLKESSRSHLASDSPPTGSTVTLVCLFIAPNKYKDNVCIQGSGLGTQHPLSVDLHLQNPACPSHPGASMAGPYIDILPCTKSEARGSLELQEEDHSGPILVLHSTATSSISHSSHRTECTGRDQDTGVATVCVVLLEQVHVH